jgi:hypothetical protein
MRDVKRWFGWMLVVLVVHMLEQLIFGIDELYEMQTFMAAWHSLFTNADYGTVVIVFAVVALVQLIAMGGVAGGRWPLLSAGFFGVAGIGEAHHVIKTIANGAYFPGAVSAIAFSACGALLLAAVIREFRTGSPVPVQG